jgi:hypothetical protein
VSALVRCMLGVCALASACHVPPPPPAAPLQQPSRPEPPPAAQPDTSPPEEPVATPPSRAVDRDEPVAAQFGLPLPPGHYTFPNGLRLQFSAKHECEYDSTDPCSPFDVVAWFKGKEGKANILTGNTARVVGHAMQVTADQSIVVRK